MSWKTMAKLARERVGCWMQWRARTNRHAAGATAVRGVTEVLLAVRPEGEVPVGAKARAALPLISEIALSPEALQGRRAGPDPLTVRAPIVCLLTGPMVMRPQKGFGRGVEAYLLIVWRQQKIDSSSIHA